MNFITDNATRLLYYGVLFYVLFMGAALLYANGLEEDSPIRKRTGMVLSALFLFIAAVLFWAGCAGLMARGVI